MQIFDLTRQGTCRFVLLLMTCLFLGACGTSDVSEEGVDFSVSMTVKDAGSTTRDIDTIQNGDCNDDGTADDPETFTNVGGDITIVSKDTARAIRVESYTVDFLPHQGDDGTGNLYTPPTLNSYPEAIVNSVWIGTGTSATISSLTVMTINTKNDYETKRAAAGLGNVVSLYSIRVTLNIVDDEGGRFSLVVDEQVTLSGYDNC